MFPSLVERVVLVRGHGAYGVYDLNTGRFHRINLDAGETLMALDGTKNVHEYDEATNEFLVEASSLGLVQFNKFSEFRKRTELDEVLRKVRPVQFAWIEITSKCNQLCAHCFLGEDLNRYPHVDKEKIFEYLETLHLSGARQLIISGGEPTVHPDFIEILERAAVYRFRLSLLSNASSPNYASFIPYFARAEITVKVPILGWEGSHEKMTNLKSGFQRTIKNIIAMVDAGIKVELGTTVTGINYKHVPKIREFANSLRLPLEVSPVYAVGYAKHNSDEILNVAQDEIIDICQQDKLAPTSKPRSYPAGVRDQYSADATDYEAVNLRDYLTEHHECGQKIIAILSSGEVTPCLMLRDQKFSLGSTHVWSLKDILERKSNRAEASEKLMSLAEIPECSGCEARFACKAGGCPASALAFAG